MSSYGKTRNYESSRLLNETNLFSETTYLEVPIENDGKNGVFAVILTIIGTII